MSAINAIVTPTAAHMLVDGLCYHNGEVTSVDAEKSYRLRGMRAAVAATGDARTGYFFQAAIEQEFTRFDDVIAAGSEFFVQGLKAFAHRFCGGNAVSNVVLIGWLESENRPAAFGIDLVAGCGQWKSARRSCDAPTRVLTELPIIAVPPPSLDEIKTAHYPLGSTGDAVKSEEKLLHLMEMQRRIPADDGKFYVGGQAMLTTFTAESVTQRVVHRWEEDKIGELVKPAEIDWAAWRERRETRASL
jgi:hypothetical protein